MNYDLIADLPVFLAYSLELEKEAAERLRKCSAMMNAQNQHALANTFAELAVFSEEHAAEVKNICETLGLPDIPSAQSPTHAESPESLEGDPTMSEMSTREALETMLVQEKESANFYSEVANRTTNREIRKFARAFADEEMEHAQALENWLGNLPGEN